MFISIFSAVKNAPSARIQIQSKELGYKLLVPVLQRKELQVRVARDGQRDLVVLYFTKWTEAFRFTTHAC